MTISTEAIKSALSALIDPVTGTDYVSGKMFKSAETDENGNVKVFIELGYPAKHRAEAVGQAVGLGGGAHFRLFLAGADKQQFPPHILRGHGGKDLHQKQRVFLAVSYTHLTLPTICSV